MFIESPTFADLDSNYVDLQGADDVTKNLGGVNSDSYMVSLFKRKFSTGDTNRDSILASDAN